MDTGGQDTFREMTTSYVRKGAIALLCFSVDNQKSFDDLPEWLDFISRVCSKMPLILLVGTKCDLRGRDGEEEVPKDRAQAFAVEHKLEYIETSAMGYVNIQELADLLERMIKQLDEPGTDVVIEGSENGGEKRCC
jgi:small GTP-binding protein